MLFQDAARSHSAELSSSIPIIAVAKNRDVINAESEAISAGANIFMYFKTTNYVTNLNVLRP